ncbi:unnamed protein product [Linum trigynum]|uniref:Uncharacterized protein n=1 Tax=Linum trigynum TaxID=586398 RepID=A0AAV2FH50_9ROSI
MNKLENEIVDVRNAVPHIFESVLQRLGVRLPELFDMDNNSEANRKHGRVGKTQDNDESTTSLMRRLPTRLLLLHEFILMLS